MWSKGSAFRNSVVNLCSRTRCELPSHAKGYIFLNKGAIYSQKLIWTFTSIGTKQKRKISPLKLGFFLSVYILQPLRGSSSAKILPQPHHSMLCQNLFFFLLLTVFFSLLAKVAMVFAFFTSKNSCRMQAKKPGWKSNLIDFFLRCLGVREERQTYIPLMGKNVKEEVFSRRC